MGSGGAAPEQEGPVRSAAIETPRILLVCTANQCRSPLAEALLRSLLAERGVAASVGSAGLMAGGMPATATGVEVLLDRGIDPGQHRSRNLADPGVELATADLVIGMERRHVQEAVLLVRRAEAAPPRPADVPLRDWAERLSAGRTNADLLGLGDDGVADPIGRPRADYEATADLLADLLARLVGRAFPIAARDGVEARSA
jgi:protein-tyrosine phosphatase